MVHKVKKGVYKLQWRPKDTPKWITDPTFKLKKPELAWSRFTETVSKTKTPVDVTDLRLVKNGKVLLEYQAGKGFKKGNPTFFQSLDRMAVKQGKGMLKVMKGVAKRIR